MIAAILMGSIAATIAGVFWYRRYRIQKGYDEMRKVYGKDWN